MYIYIYPLFPVAISRRGDIDVSPQHWDLHNGHCKAILLKLQAELLSQSLCSAMRSTLAGFSGSSASSHMIPFARGPRIPTKCGFAIHLYLYRHVRCLLRDPAFQTQATVALPELWASLASHVSWMLHRWRSPVVHAVLSAPCETTKNKSGMTLWDHLRISLLPRISWTFTHRMWPHNALVGWHPVGAEIIGKFWHCSCKCTCCLSTVSF